MPSRREFLQQASLLTTGILINKNEWFKRDQVVGLQLYTLRDKLGGDGLKPTIARIAQIGFRDVETFGYGDGKYFGLSTTDFAKIFRDNGLKTSSGHYMLVGFLGKGDLDEAKRAIADSKPLEHDFFTIPYLLDSMRTSLDDYKKLADRLNKAGELAKAAGMKLAYHNHNFEFQDWGGGQTGYSVLLKETDPGLVNFEMDIFWVTKAGMDPIKLMKENPGRFKMWHVKDMDNTAEKTFTEVGSGIINYKEIFKYQKTSGLQHFFIEQDQIKGDEFDSIARSLTYVKTNLL